ncbi:MAG: penicillin acylase family protein [Promethearchaeota archaeon]
MADSLKNKERINKKKEIIKVSSVLGGLVLLIIAFSMPLGLIPPLGRFLFPGDGVWSIQNGIPEYERIDTDYVSHEVRVYRDQFGIPHIYGTNESDLMFALGYCQAEDRLFQMDMMRRASEGLLSQILGPLTLPQDEFSLNMLKVYWGNKTLIKIEELAKTDPEIQNIYNMLTHFTAGINYFIDNHKDDLPLEFKFLNYKPARWTNMDTVMAIFYMTEMLTWNYWDFYNEMLYNTLGAGNYTLLYGYPLPYQIPVTTDYGNYSDITPPTSKFSASNEQINDGLPQSAGNDQNEGNQAEDIVSYIAKRFIEDVKKVPGEKSRLMNPLVIGSNNWAVSGSKTKSGKPILCNDMHLPLNIPNIWYEAHLINLEQSNKFNYYGFFIAGVPVPIVGHNDYIAWGFTNVGYDVLDWYYYTKVDDDHYIYNGSIKEFGKIQYKIPVKGQDDVVFTIKTTVDGPVFDDLSLPINSTLLANNSIVVAAKWIAHSDIIYKDVLAFYGYLHAHNRTEFDEASANFVCPAQNHIYADIHGTIGIRPTGWVPIRDDSKIPGWHLGNGTMPYNGSAGEGSWTGFLPFSELPHSENPAQGYLVSANQISAGPEYLKNYTLQNPFSVANGYRARRINDLLASHTDITVDDMKKFQLDVYSVRAGNFTPYLINALDSLSQKTPLQQSAYNILKNWDYTMDKDKVAPTLFNIWAPVLKEQIFKDQMDLLGIDLYPKDAVVERLIKQYPNSPWFDNISTPNVETRDDILISAFNTTLNALVDYFGTDNISQWTWGKIHKRVIKHITGLSALGVEPFAYNGSSFVITPASSQNWKDGKVVEGESVWGSSERLIVDFADINNTISVIPGGESGLINSKHYTDQLDLYLAGQYHTQYFGITNYQDFSKDLIESELYIVPK